MLLTSITLHKFPKGLKPMQWVIYCTHPFSVQKRERWAEFLQIPKKLRIKWLLWFTDALRLYNKQGPYPIPF